MSKTKLKHASYSIKKLMDKSALAYETRDNYKGILNASVKQLDQLGFKLDDIRQLKQKHIHALVEIWKDQYLNVATIKNRLSSLRYACKLMDKRNVIQKNDDYAIGNRSYIPNRNKAVTLINFDKIADPYIKSSLELQSHFGLRREECIKFKVAAADKGDHIQLQGSWTKGGVQRIIPITTAEQRQCLDDIKKLCGIKSLIPENKSYIEQRNLYDNVTHQAGLVNLHGLRHAYAQKRYAELVNSFTNGHGWLAPIAGGPERKQLSAAQKNIDFMARSIVSRNLGHSRIAITKIYLK